MNRVTFSLGAAVLLLALGCVITTKHTIDAHITVDIRHIEKQADAVLDFVEGKTDALPGAPEAQQEAPKKTGTPMLYRVIDLVNPMRSAYAAELKETSPLVTQIAKKMKERHPQLEAFKAKGCAGENNRGQVELRPCGETSSPDKKNEAQQLIASENADRKALYREVASLNQESNVTVGTVERIYAQKRLERAQPGQLFQLPDAGADFDAFKNSALGKKLGADCAPGAWVTIK